MQFWMFYVLCIFLKRLKHMHFLLLLNLGKLAFNHLLLLIIIFFDYIVVTVSVPVYFYDYHYSYNCQLYQNVLYNIILIFLFIMMNLVVRRIYGLVHMSVLYTVMCLIQYFCYRKNLNIMVSEELLTIHQNLNSMTENIVNS